MENKELELRLEINSLYKRILKTNYKLDKINDDKSDATVIQNIANDLFTTMQSILDKIEKQKIEDEVYEST